MGKINTAERVSREMSDNFVFQRSLLAYHAAAQRIGGDVLEIGTGAGYGIEVVAPHARSFITVDKFAPAAELARHPHVEFHQAVVPPLAFAANSFDFVISFQVIEHVKQDIELVREVKRVLKPGGKFIVTTPNAPMSLTRNQRSLLAYHAAAQRIGGDVLEIGTGAGYGIEVVAPHARSFITVDKFAPAAELARHPHVEFHQAVVPPLAFAANSFDFVISFQVIEHVKQDIELVREVKRVLKPGGKFIVTTPNAPMSLTRNPWHVREYTAEQLQILLGHEFRSVETLGVAGNGKVMEYYEQNRRSVARITRFDILDLQHRLPRRLLQLPYDILNRINRRKLLKANTDLISSIRMEDYRICPVSDDCFDLFYVAEK